MADAAMLDLPLALLDFHYSDAQWASIEQELTAAGIDPAGARPIIEEAVSLWLLGWTKQDARQEARTTRSRIEKFKRAAADIGALLPETARRSLKRMIKTLEVLAEGDDAAALGAARPKNLAEELCRTWRYHLGGEVKGSRNPLTGEAGGPLVRFLTAATAPIEGEALTASQAFERIKDAKKKIAAGKWP